MDRVADTLVGTRTQVTPAAAVQIWMIALTVSLPLFAWAAPLFAVTPPAVMPPADTTQTGAAPPPGKIAYEDCVKFVRTLLTVSSATRQIDASGIDEAVAKREHARAHYEAAQAAYAAGDHENADAKLLTATKVMFEAVRLAGKKDVVSAKKRRDFTGRLESINALLAAHQRVSQEKGKQFEGVGLRELVEDKVKQAQGLLERGDLDIVRTVLDEAYVMAKLNIKALREGDTLVRTLHFETKEEEYHYEIDRNDSHRMLLGILLNDKRDDAGFARMLDSFVEKAEKLRVEAEKQAAQGQHEAAVRTLEEAISNFTRAMRSGGVYIPE